MLDNLNYEGDFVNYALLKEDEFHQELCENCVQIKSRPKV